MEPNVLEAVGRVERAAKTANPETRVVNEIAIGQSVRQGDIYLTRIPDSHPRGAPREDRQLAPGESRGSRHVVEGSGVALYEPIAIPAGFAKGALLGPVICASEGFTVTHPEHAHFALPAGTYQCTYQMDPRSLQRVED